MFTYMIRIVLIVKIFVIFSPLVVIATDVGGIINTNTTWALDSSPYTITSVLQVAEGVTLTIEPGVVINGYGRIELWGVLSAIGTSTSKITFNSVVIYPNRNS